METHKSRFGFHPCSYEMFLKLKALNRMYWEALHQQAAWHRWERKEPHNRVIRPRIRNSKGEVVAYGATIPRPEPKLNSFLEKVTYQTRQDRQGQWQRTAISREKVVFKEGWGKVLSDYSNARYAKPTPEEVKPLELSIEQIDKLLM